MTKDITRTEPSCSEGFRNKESQESSKLNDTHDEDELDDELYVKDECRNEEEEEEEDSLEWMIETMMMNNDNDDDDNGEDGGICVDPRHFHSFTSSNIAITNYFLRPTCSFCNERISNYYHIVKCVACGTYAHRSCSFSITTNPNNKCPVNQLKIDTSFKNNHNTQPENNELTMNLSTQSNNTDDDQSIKEDAKDAQQPIHVNFSLQQNNDNEQQTVHSSTHHSSSDANNDETKENVKSLSPTSQDIAENIEDEAINDSCWSNNGPPQHWASTQTIENIANRKKSQSNKSIFHTVSCVLQEHVSLLKKNHGKSEEDESNEGKDTDDDADQAQNNSNLENLQDPYLY